METPHSVERDDGFPVTIEVKSSRNVCGCLRTDAGGRATRKQEDRNAKETKISEIWMGRQDQPLAVRSFAQKPLADKGFAVHEHAPRCPPGLLSRIMPAPGNMVTHKENAMGMLSPFAAANY
jgi:hypothetical protein